MSQTQTQHQESDFTTELRHLRREIKMLATRVKAQHANSDLQIAPIDQAQHEGRQEAHANLTLAFRHLEDAAMRLGKAIQAHDGGTSVYDQSEA